MMDGCSKVLRPTRHKIDHFRDIVPNNRLNPDVAVIMMTNSNKLQMAEKISVLHWGSMGSERDAFLWTWSRECSLSSPHAAALPIRLHRRRRWSHRQPSCRRRCHRPSTCRRQRNSPRHFPLLLSLWQRPLHSAIDTQHDDSYLPSYLNQNKFV